LGGIYTYNIRNEGIEFESSKNNDVITVLNASYNPLISDKQVGYSFGGGVQFSLRYRNILSLGLRYSNLYRVSEQGSLNEKTIHLISSISF
jgi:opacity protein-like surface antigen